MRKASPSAMASPKAASTAAQQAGNAPICSGSTTCWATTSPCAFISAQEASCDFAHDGGEAGAKQRVLHLLHDAGDAEFPVPNRLLDHRAGVAGCVLRDIDSTAQVIAQHVVLPLHMGAFPACCEAVLRPMAMTLPKATRFLSTTPMRAAVRMRRTWRLSPRFSSAARCSVFVARSRTKATLAVRCLGPAPVRREKYSTKACTFRRFDMCAAAQNFEIERIIAANSRTPELVLGDIRGQIGASRLGEQRVRELFGRFGEGQALTVLTACSNSPSEDEGRNRRMGGRPLRGGTLHR